MAESSERSEGARPAARPLRPSGAHAVPYAELMTTVAHELRSLVDGSRRRLGLAAQALRADEPATIPDAQRQLADVLAALERMSGLLRDAMSATPGVIGSPSLGCYEAVSLGDAARHAVAVVEPVASLDGVSIGLDVDHRAAVTPVGPLYPAMLNGLRNAIEAIAQLRAHPADPAPGGRVRLAARLLDDGTLSIRIEDDGPGPPEADCFAHGFTTKAQGTGLGLAIVRSIVERLAGGSCALRRGEGSLMRPGAVLEVRARPSWAARAALPPPASDAA